MKTTFKVTYEWSDYSEFSPSHRGQLPVAVILPSGRRVDLYDEDIAVAAAAFSNRHPNSRATYTPLTRDGEVRAKMSSWGDDGRRNYGRSGATLEVIAPKGSGFRFDRYCEFCGEVVSEATAAAANNSERNGEPHPGCKAEYESQQMMISADDAW